ncbi:MAG: HIT family protein [Patescibacteria group bacterium]|jgi:histidine triad (HIT) family protein
MCVFCEIIKGNLPCHKVYEDEKFLAFLSIGPVNPGHTLVVPKEHYQYLEEVPEDDLKNLLLICRKIGGLLKLILGNKDYNLTLNNGPDAGQTVPHLHFHVIPRHEGDGHLEWPSSEYVPGEAEKIAESLREKL